MANRGRGLRRAFAVLVAQYGNAAYTASTYIGGQHISRDVKGSDEGSDPIVPVDGAKQREALDFLVDTILSDEAFEFSPRLLRRLTGEHWYHWGSGMSLGADVNVYDRVLRIQQIVLRHCFDASVLHRLQNQQLMVDDERADDDSEGAENAEPLQISELFRTLTDSIWSELEEPQGELECSVIRRNLQAGSFESTQSTRARQSNQSVRRLVRLRPIRQRFFESPSRCAEFGGEPT